MCLHVSNIEQCNGKNLATYIKLNYSYFLSMQENCIVIRNFIYIYIANLTAASLLDQMKVTKKWTRDFWSSPGYATFSLLFFSFIGHAEWFYVFIIKQNFQQKTVSQFEPVVSNVNSFNQTNPSSL